VNRSSIQEKGKKLEDSTSLNTSIRGKKSQEGREERKAYAGERTSNELSARFGKKNEPTKALD